MESVALKVSLPSGQTEDCQVDFSPMAPFRLIARSPALGTVETQGDSLFAALTQLRIDAEAAGCRLLCNGARLNAYPSRMSSEMGGGRKVYVLRSGHQARRSDMVDIFEPASIEDIATVQEQREFYAAWIRSLQ